VSILVENIRLIRKKLKYTKLMMSKIFKDWISHLCSVLKHGKETPRL